MAAVVDPSDVIAIYTQGASINAVSRISCLDVRRIGRILDEHNIQRHQSHRAITIADQRMVDAYHSGQGIHDLCATYGWSYCKVRNALLNAGVTLRPPGRPTKGNG